MIVDDEKKTKRGEEALEANVEGKIVPFRRRPPLRCPEDDNYDPPPTAA